jgi:hypothetical protein
MPQASASGNVLAVVMFQAIEAGDANITLVTLSRLGVGLHISVDKLMRASRRISGD